MSLLLIDLLKQAATNENGASSITILRSDKERVFSSYKDLLRRAQSLAVRLSDTHAVSPKDVILIHMPTTSLSSFVAFWACQYLGAIPCPLPCPHPDPKRQADIIQHLSNLFDQPLVLSTKQDLSSWESNSLKIIAVDRDDIAPPQTFQLQSHPSNQHDIAALMLTSGSTGMPKAVQLSHHNIISAIKSKSLHLDTSVTSRYLNWIGADHVACLTEIHLASMLHSASQYHIPAAQIINRPRLFLELISELGITYTFAPNFLLAQILRDDEQQSHDQPAKKLDLTSLNSLISGGEAVPQPTAQRFDALLQRYGARSGALIAGFGMSETCAGCIYRSAGGVNDVNLPNAPVGFAYPALEARVLQESGEKLQSGTGELILRGPSLTRGYYRNDTATADAFTSDGWFRTGDLATISQDRVISLVGRAKEVLLINGSTISCTEVVHGIEEAGITNLVRSFTVVCPYRPPNSSTESYIVAFLSQSTNEDEEVAAAFDVERQASIAAGHWPYAVLPLDCTELSKSTLGKISASRISKAFAQGQYSAIQARIASARAARHRASDAARQVDNPLNDIERRMAVAVQEILGLEVPPGRSESFVDLGCSSLAFMRMRTAFASILFNDDEGDARLPVIQLLRHPSIAELTEAVHGDTGRNLCNGIIRQSQASLTSSTQTYDPIVPLTTKGDGTPLFLVHPGVGECLVFVNLAKRFRGQRPVYALRARGLAQEDSVGGDAQSDRSDDGESGPPLTASGSFQNFEDMVECYTAAIVATHPSGPYAIAGYSFGGVVAFEISKRLESSGHLVKFTGILNIPPNISWRMKQLDWQTVAINLGLFLDLVPEDQVDILGAQMEAERRVTSSVSVSSSPKMDEGCHMSELGSSAHDTTVISLTTKSTIVNRILQQASSGRLSSLGLGHGAVQRWVDVAADLASSARTYVPTGKLSSSCRTCLFVAIPLAGLGTREQWYENHLRSWNEFIEQEQREGPHVVYVDGAHYTMLDDENVESFYGHLHRELSLAGL